MDKIIEEFDFAIQWLPEKPATGRIGKDVARQLKARTCLHEGTYYKYHTELGWADKADRLLKMAADETDAIMATGKYEIYNTGHPEKDYYDVFVMEDKTNLKEAILPVTYLDGKRKHGMSRTLAEANTGFSKDFVESYLCLNGKPITGNDQYKGDTNMKDETTDRDPRLKQTILTWDFPTRVTVATNDSTYIEKEEDFISQYCLTGYKSIKYFIPTDKAFEANNNTYDGIAYRYAETLLINAEAKAELGTITQADLNKTINVLRDRAGMPHLTLEVGFTDPNWPAWGYSLTPLLQEIRRERRIELAGEGFRWDDLARWKAGAICNNVKTYIGKREPYKEGQYAIVYPAYTNDNYSYEAGKSRTWNDRLYLRPIPTGELQRNDNLSANPGWILLLVSRNEFPGIFYLVTYNLLTYHENKQTTVCRSRPDPTWRLRSSCESSRSHLTRSRRETSRLAENGNVCFRSLWSEHLQRPGMGIRRFGSENVQSNQTGL